ncbi:ATP-grasp domain-containing protein [Marinomonas sp. TI.3.20]|uniref:ATP-grasp domain-containing protein n=1 Tax=Marinomonas sp. TI.3.20 TaxID=3121296 RepID=UPI00311DCEAD
MNDIKYILFLGFRKSLVNKALSRGFTPIVLVKKVKKGLENLKYYIVNDLEDAQEILRLISSFRDISLYGVVTGHEQGVFTAALIRSCFGLPGPKSYYDLLNFRDKYIQKTLVKDIWQCAKCIYVKHDMLYDDIVSSLGHPFIIKPANGAGSKKTQIISNENEFKLFIQNYGDISDLAIVAESIIYGQEYCVDGLWKNNELVWFVICKYNSNVINYHQGKAVAVQTLSHTEHANLYSDTSKLILSVMRSLKVDTTVFHLEFFDTDTGLVFSECASRIGGGLIPEIIEMSYGIDWFDIQFEYCLGLKIDHKLPMNLIQPHAFIYLQSHSSFSQTESDYRNKFKPKDIDFSSKEKENQPGSYKNSGYIIVNDDSFEKLDRKVRSIATFNETGVFV